MSALLIAHPEPVVNIVPGDTAALYDQRAFSHNLAVRDAADAYNAACYRYGRYSVEALARRERWLFLREQAVTP